MKKVLFTLLLLVGMMSCAWAQVDDVILVVSGEGATKDEATAKALRSAVEQAFGVFVSSNTQILNDELVKDEIATVSSGNIKSYTELGTITKANGNTEVSLQAIVSVRNLCSYTQSHGAQTEFAGATFAANMKMVELNRQNTQKALRDLEVQLNTLEKDLIDCEIEMGIPQENGTVEVTLFYYANKNIENFYSVLVSTLRALSIPESMHSAIRVQGIRTYSYTINQGRYSEDIMLYCQIPSSLNREWGDYGYYIVDNLGNRYHLTNATDFVRARITTLDIRSALLKKKTDERRVMKITKGTLQFNKAIAEKLSGFEAKK